MLMARVKEDSAQPIIVACTGRQYVKTEWRQVPAGMDDEAKAQPNLEVRSAKALETAAEKKAAKPKAKPKAEKETKAVVKDGE